MYEALLRATPEYQKVAASFGSAGPAALFGLPPAGRALLYAALQKDLSRVLCIVTPGEAEATHFADDLKALGLTAAVFPPRDFMLRPVEGAGREYEYRRLSVLGALAGGRLQAVCVPAEALLQYTVPRAEFIQNTLTLKPGMVYTREALVARLFAAGYVRRSQVDGPGQFSVRGDIVDIYAPDMRQPARVEYWDDEIDSMSSFDPVSYTHLDVYKRQLMAFMPFCLSIITILLDSLLVLSVKDIFCFSCTLQHKNRPGFLLRKPGRFVCFIGAFSSAHAITCGGS